MWVYHGMPESFCELGRTCPACYPLASELQALLDNYHANAPA